MDDSNYFCFCKSLVHTSQMTRKRWNISDTFPILGPVVQDCDLIEVVVLQYCKYNSVPWVFFGKAIFYLMCLTATTTKFLLFNFHKVS